jgi:CRP-like cAMP-binding protein
VGESLNEFQALLNECEAFTYPAGTDLFAAGDPGECLYVVKAGSVRLHIGDRDLETVAPGGIFGEMALVDGAPRNATATAVTDVEVVPIDERRFERLVHRAPFFAQMVMRVLADRLRRTVAELERATAS